MKRCIGQLLNITLVVRETRIEISALKLHPNFQNNTMENTSESRDITDVCSDTVFVIYTVNQVGHRNEIYMGWTSRSNECDSKYPRILSGETT